MSGRATQWVLFLVLWAVYALTIDKRDLHFYDLHHTGAAAIAEHHRFYNRDYIEGYGVGTDQFPYQGKVYPNKQPGSILAGAAAYSVLRPFGLSYLGSYFLTAALVTLLTSGLCTAAAAVLLYRVALDWTSSGPWSLACALAWGLGTTAWPYTGTVYHDAMAATFLFAAFYFQPRRALACGFFLGLALTTSLLVSAMTAVLAVAFLLMRERRQWSRFALGGLAGVVPLLIYGYVCFDNPFAQAVFVSEHAQYLHARFDLGVYAALLWTYVRTLVGYTPITVLGLVGIALLPAARRRERLLLAALVVGHLGFVVVSNATGACQYGPRMLLPMLPFAALGLSAFAALRRRALVASAVVLTLLVSVAFNLLGALYGTHFCRADRWAVASYVDGARNGVGFSLPLLEAMGAPRGEASVEMDRAHAEFFANEARVYVALGDLPEAHRRIEAAVAMAPDLALVHRYRANVAYLEGDLAGAAAALERALEIEPGDPVLRENLALLRRQLAGR